MATVTMAPNSTHVNLVWLRLLETATREVFEAMLGETAEPSANGDEGENASADFLALVGLSGALCGSLSVRCQAGAAYHMGSQMLGEPMEHHDEFVTDALGEIANMVAGNFKSKLPGLADACRLSVPTVIQGSESTRDFGPRGEQLESSFLFQGQPFWVRLDIWPETA